MTTVNGLPAHILLVHAIVVLLPLSALVLVLTACLAPVRRRLAGANAILSVLVVILVPITTDAGEWLERRVARTPLVRAHTELGDTAIWAAIPVAVLAVALWWRQREAGAGGDAGAAGSGGAAASSDAVTAGGGASGDAGSADSAAAGAGAAVPDAPVRAGVAGSGALAGTDLAGAGGRERAGATGSGPSAGADAAVPDAPVRAGAAESGASRHAGAVAADASAGAAASDVKAGAGAAAADAPCAAEAGSVATRADHAEAGQTSGASHAAAAGPSRRRTFLAPASKAVTVTLIVLSVLAAGAASYDIVRIGDSGAQASWQGQFQQNPLPRVR